jgi:beta-lactamase class A
MTGFFLSLRHGAVALIAMLALLQPARAQDAVAAQLESRAADVVAVFAGTKPYAEVFAPVFQAAVPESQLQALGDQLEQQFGALQGVDSVVSGTQPGAATIALRLERAVAHGQMQIETTAPYRITGLRITSFDAAGDTPQRLAEEIAALPGEAGVLLTRLGADAPILAHRADQPLAIGSAMKLYVLSALARAVEAGEHRWDEVVTLGQRSLPSGQMQDWPERAPVTLQTLATMMIAISDNTATDALIGVLGREAVEAELRASGHARPDLNRPFLTTRELFLMKSASDGEVYTYAHGGEQERREMIAALAGTAIDLAAFTRTNSGQPRALAVEWFASGQDLARILDRLRSLEDDTALRILQVSPSLTPEARAYWAYAGFKGGSEPGVLNLTWLLRDKAGAWYVLAMSWNDPAAPVDQQRFTLLSQRLMALTRSAGE